MYIVIDSEICRFSHLPVLAPEPDQLIVPDSPPDTRFLISVTISALPTMDSPANQSENNAWITPIDREKWLLGYASNESERKALEAVELSRRQRDPAEALSKLDVYEMDNLPTAMTTYYRYMLEWGRG
jgi:hypothetical protein